MLSTVAEARSFRTRVIYHMFVTKVQGGFSGYLTGHLDSMMESFLDRLDDAEVVDTRPISRRGFPGVGVELRQNGGQAVSHVHVYLGRTRAYFIGTSFAVRDMEPGRRESERFFASMVLDEEDSPMLVGDGVFDAAQVRTIFPPHDDFAVQMPGKAAVILQPFVLGARRAESRVYRVSSADASVRFEVHVTSTEDMEAECLLERATTMRVTEGRRIRAQRETERQGYAAVEITHELAGNVSYSLYVQTRARLYEVFATMPSGREAELAALRERFFQSLRIL